MGEVVAHAFDQFHTDLCFCNWYLFPIDVQKMFCLVMMNSQQPVIVQGYGNTLCTRFAFKTVKFRFMPFHQVLIFDKLPILIDFYHFRLLKVDFLISWCFAKLMDKLIILVVGIFQCKPSLEGFFKKQFPKMFIEMIYDFLGNSNFIHILIPQKFENKCIGCEKISRSFKSWVATRNERIRINFGFLFVIIYINVS